MQLIKDYMRNDAQRHMLNDLTRETFGFDFEAWVTEGYFEGDYMPYSFEEDGRLIANASANRMEFCLNGERKHFIQIGTVMTREAYRKKGYAAALIREILTDWEGKCDGIYLFGNLSAVGFYEKLGFARVDEHRYTLKATVTPTATSFVPVTDVEAYKAAVRAAVPNGAFEQVNRYGLTMFYTADPEAVWYAAALDCYVVLEDGVLQSVIAPQKLPLAEVIAQLPVACSGLGFTPAAEDAQLCEAERYDGAEDYRLFCIGEGVRCVETEKLYFPVLSHA